MDNPLDYDNFIVNEVSHGDEHPLSETVKSESDIIIDELDNKFIERRKIRKQLKRKRESIQWIQAVIFAVLLTYVVDTFVFERAKVDGSSMMPTITTEESLFEYKLGYCFGPPKRGDIIIFEYKPGKIQNRYIPWNDKDEENFVKRVVGLPGETVEIRNDNFVYINGRKLIEPYLDITSETRGITPPGVMREGDLTRAGYPMVLRDDEVFVLGDNRRESKDSRIIGPVNLSLIRGKAVMVMYPFGNIRTLKGDCYLENPSERITSDGKRSTDEAGETGDKGS